jgi:hypothetical protein
MLHSDNEIAVRTRDSCRTCLARLNTAALFGPVTFWKLPCLGLVGANAVPNIAAYWCDATPDCASAEHAETTYLGEMLPSVADSSGTWDLGWGSLAALYGWYRGAVDKVECERSRDEKERGENRV